MKERVKQSIIRMMPRILQSLRRLERAATPDEVIDDLLQVAESDDGELLDDLETWDVINKSAFAHLQHYGLLRQGKRGKWELTPDGANSKWPDWSFLTASTENRSSAQLIEIAFQGIAESSTESAGQEEMTEHMAPIALPAVKEFYNPTLVAMHNLNGSASNHQIYDEAMRLMDLSEEQRAIPHKTSISLATNRVLWALYHLKQAELLHSPSRAFYELTEKGRSTQVVDPSDVNKLSQAKLNQRRRKKHSEPSETLDSYTDWSIEGSALGSKDPVQNEEVRVSSQPSRSQSTAALPLEELIESYSDWRVDLLNAVRQLAEQNLVAFLRRVLDSEHGGGFKILSSQGGIVEGTRASGGIAPTTLLFHCYFGTRQISVAELNNLRHAVTMNRADRGLIITLGTVTGEARRQSANSRAPVIDVMDGDTLVNQLKSLNIGIVRDIIQVERVTIDPDFFANI